MTRLNNVRLFAILFVFVVTAFSLTGIFGERLAVPLIVFALSVLFFTLTFESVRHQDTVKAKRFLTVGLVLFVLFVALTIYAWTR